MSAPAVQSEITGSPHKHTKLTDADIAVVYSWLLATRVTPVRVSLPDSCLSHDGQCLYHNSNIKIGIGYSNDKGSYILYNTHTDRVLSGMAQVVLDFLRGSDYVHTYAESSL